VFALSVSPSRRHDLVRNVKNNIQLGWTSRAQPPVLQVQIQDAVKADADQTMDGLKEDLRKQSVTWSSMDRNDPTRVEDADNVEIYIKGVPATQTSSSAA